MGWGAGPAIFRRQSVTSCGCCKSSWWSLARRRTLFACSGTSWLSNKSSCAPNWVSRKGGCKFFSLKVARRSDVDSELAVRKVELQDSTETARRARAAADSTAARAKQLRDERARNASKYRHDLDTQDAQIRNLQREVDALTELAKSIEVMQGRVENAEVLKAKLAIADDSVRSAERELEGLRARLEAAEEKRQKKEAIREALQANIRLKSIEEEVERHQQEISSLLKDLGGRDIEALRKQLSNVRTRAMELQKQRSFREGELVQTREAIRSLEVELASPLYAGPMKICRVLVEICEQLRAACET